jgi:hypothetical protein
MILSLNSDVVTNQSSRLLDPPPPQNNKLPTMDVKSRVCSRLVVAPQAAYPPVYGTS